MASVGVDECKDPLAQEPISNGLRHQLMSGLALAPAGANVIMQLARLPIGRGVAESVVESGSLYAHPFKRTRTTLSYILIALFGTDHEREVLRREVNRQHRAVHSQPGSDVAYNAFDPDLQLWVAACMFRGFVDSVTFLYGPANPDVLDEMYRLSARFATTLQVAPRSWPVDREAFARYWELASAQIRMDDVTRGYLNGLAGLTFLPLPAQWVLGRFHRFITAGFLPAEFRAELGLSWSDDDQRWFERALKWFAYINALLPSAIREFPWNVVLWDARRRIRANRPLV